MGTAAVSAKAAPSHRALKLRDVVSGRCAGVDRAALRAALEIEERGGSGGKLNATGEAALPLTGPGSAAVRALDDDAELADDDGDGGGGGGEPVRKRARVSTTAGIDDDDDDDESDSDGDDEEALMAELVKIRAERAAERAAAEAEAEAEAEDTARENPLLGNLLDDDTASVATATTLASVAVKRRWNDDVLFKDQARGERRAEQRFVNDTVRNDFHRRFLRRYIL